MMFAHLQFSQRIGTDAGSGFHPTCNTQCPEECNGKFGHEWRASGTPPGYDPGNEMRSKWHKWNTDESLNVKCGKDMAWIR